MVIVCMAQNHDYFMPFGYYSTLPHPLLGGATIDFNSRPPAIYPEMKKINMGFYCGACSDSTGKLLFYTNGISIRDITHNRMLNGDTLNPGPIWLQWQHDSYPNGPFCFALPAPGKHNQYYFFHLSATITNVANSCPYFYSIVDMEGNNGLGKVTLKNQVLLPVGQDYIHPVAVKHGNGRDWWVITGVVNKPLLYTFLLDNEGVHGPFTTIMPYQFPGQDYQSVNTVSPDGTTYIRAAGRRGIYVYNFDRCSGTFHNLRAIPFANDAFFCFASVFAPDSKHLYLSSFEVVTVLDISSPNIISTLDTVAYFDGKASPSEPFVTGFFNPNLAANGKIYYATTNSTISLHVIHNPDLPGQAADVEQHGITLPKYNDGTMCIFPNYRLGELEGAPCDTINGQKQDGKFQKTTWKPPVVNNQAEFTLLPPLFQNAKPPTEKGARDLNMAEMAIKQRLEATKPHGNEQKILKTNKN